MGIGYLRVECATAFEAVPVPGAWVTVRREDGEALFGLETDRSGHTETVSLWAPDASHTLSPGDPGPFYATYQVEVIAQGYQSVVVHGVQIFDTETSILPVEMLPALRGGGRQEILIPENALNGASPRLQQGAEAEDGAPALRRQVVIPETITVHLGSPSSSARNVRVPFADYIKNVASSEIYPTWPDAALEANIYCQISYALNRVYTEWYPSRGYDFHITNSTAYDQYFVEGRNIYQNISVIVDNIFNVFIRRQGHGEPFFASYCNGTTVTCGGLSQWGTVPLAQQGLSAYQILRRYYPADIQLVTSDIIEGVTASYPGTPLRQGSTGDAVRRLQTMLNRVRVNYPLIPQIPQVDGIFGQTTTAAVRVFQQVFSLTVDGIVGKATWYKLVQIYNGVTKLADMESEGERIGIGSTPPTSVLRVGSKGPDVLQLQFILNFIGEFYHDIPVVLETSQFDEVTRRAVVAFQQRFGLGADGIVGPATWNQLYSVYRSVENAVTPPTTNPGGGGGSGGGSGSGNPAYPGTLLRVGSRGEDVRTMQRLLNQIFRHCPGYVPLSEDGIFGEMTRRAVVSFQASAGLAQDGIIGPATWEGVVAAANG